MIELSPVRCHNLRPHSKGFPGTKQRTALWMNISRKLPRRNAVGLRGLAIIIKNQVQGNPPYDCYF